MRIGPLRGLSQASQVAMCACTSGARSLTGRTVEREHERKRVEAELADWSARLEAVQAVANEISRELGLTPLLELIVAHAAELVGADCGIISLWDEDAEELVVQALYREDPGIRTQTLKLGQGAGGMAALHRRGLIVNDYPAWGPGLLS